MDESTIAIGSWKGRGSLNVMVTAMDCRELLERLLVRFDAENGSSMQENMPSNNNAVDEVQSTHDIDDSEAPEGDNS